MSPSSSSAPCTEDKEARENAETKVLECGGKSDATPLSFDELIAGYLSRSQSAVASDLPAQSKDVRGVVANHVLYE